MAPFRWTGDMDGEMAPPGPMPVKATPPARCLRGSDRKNDKKGNSSRDSMIFYVFADILCMIMYKL